MKKATRLTSHRECKSSVLSRHESTSRATGDGLRDEEEPPHAGRSLPLISVLAGLARSSHWIVAEALVGPEANERQSMTRFRLAWVLRGTAAAVGDAAARPTVGRHCRALGLFARYHSRTIPTSLRWT